jgi:glycosyltransferase involved in cell wall biosynthesis
MSSVTLPIALPPLLPAPRVSILMANYNYANFVGEALESVLDQSYDRFEVVACDDGSTDNSREVIRDLAARDPRVRLIEKENGGAASALNSAYEHSDGDILCLLDADDTFHPTKLDEVVNAFRTTDWGLVVHPLMVVDAAGRPIQRKPIFSNFESGWVAADVVRRGGRWSYMEASAVCLRREVATFVFPIPEDRFRTWADAYVCTLAALLAPVGFIDGTLASYRIHGSNVSGFNALDAAHGGKAMDGYVRLVSGVNERMRSLGLRQWEMDPEDNLAYLESRLQDELFGSGRSLAEAFRTYINYVRRVVSDDLYSPVRRLLSIAFFGTAFFMPRFLRPKWIGAGLTHSRVKQRLIDVGHRVRGLGRRQSTE